MKKILPQILLCFCLLTAFVNSVNGIPRFAQSKINDDIAIIVNFPEKPILIPDYPSFWNFWAHLLDFNRDNHVNVGHTGVILVDGATGDLQYWDFGRYDEREDLTDPRPELYGTVRSARHVPVLKLKIKARISNGWITNLDTILIHLGAKKIFNSYGKIEASVVYSLDLDKMIENAVYYENRGYIFYGAPTHFYCTRFVRDVIRAGGSSFGLLTFTGTQTVRHARKKWPDR